MIPDLAQIRERMKQFGIAPLDHIGSAILIHQRRGEPPSPHRVDEVVPRHAGPIAIHVIPGSEQRGR